MADGRENDFQQALGGTTLGVGRRCRRDFPYDSCFANDSVDARPFRTRSRFILDASMTKPLTAFPFATIGFRPFRETGEFVTMGVVAYDPVGRQLAFQLEDARKTARVNGLFPGLDLDLYRTATRAAREELEAVQETLGNGAPPFLQFQDPKANVFTALIAPREGIVFYPMNGRRMAETLDHAVRELFNRYVCRVNLVPQERVEEVMERNIRKLFDRLHLKQAYRPDVVVGNEQYHARFT